MKEKILIKYKNVKSDYYDCLIHLDGSRESIAALHDLKLIQKMKPLGVTFNHFKYPKKNRRIRY